MKQSCFIFFFACSVLASNASANIVTYTLTATASGTIAGVPFTNAAITVTSVANTDQVFLATPFDTFDPSFSEGGTDYQVVTFDATIDISNVGLLSFIYPMFWEDSNGAQDIILGSVGARTGIPRMSALFQGLETYNLQTSIGPISSPVDFESTFFDNFQNILTSGGALSLTASNEVFTAVVATPEPSFTIVLAASLLGFAAIRCTRRWIGGTSLAPSPPHGEPVALNKCLRVSFGGASLPWPVEPRP